MNPEHKKYILENMDKKSVARIASELGIRERKVKKIIETERDKGGFQRAVPQQATPNAVEAPAPKTAVFFTNKTMVLTSIALIIILGFAVYVNSLNGKFVYDDETLVKNNAFIKNWSVLPKVFTEDIGTGAGARYSFYRPIQMITYAMDYRIWKLNVIGYHITNILLHILVALCVWRLINILFRDRTISLLTALFFVAHPVHTTVVSYISTRAESLCLLFLLLSFIFYIKSIHEKSAIPFLIMISSYLLSLLSKENALTLPALLLLYHYTFRQKVRMREFLSVSGAAACYIFLRITALKHLMAGAVDRGTVLQRIPGFFIAVAEYFRLMLLPFGLHIEYGEKLFSLADPRAITGLAILICLSYFIFKAAKSRNLLFFSLSWFFITVLPVSNLYPLNAYMSESWLYLPSIGLFLLPAWFLSGMYKKEKWRVWALVLTGFILVFYSCLTIRQNQTWREPIPFYERTLKFSPDSSKTYINLGFTYAKMGKKEEAIAMYKKSLEINPNNAEAYNNLGIRYAEMGKKEEAVAMYKKALEIDPNQAASYNNLGIAYYSMGKKEDAVAMYKKAIKINPGYADAHNNLSTTYNSMRNEEDAVAIYKKAVELNPSNPEAYNNLGNAYNSIGEKEDAIAVYKKAININPDYAIAYNNLANIYGEMGRKEEAIAMYKKAIDIDPDYANAYYNLGGEYYNMGRREDAIAAFKKVLEINPDHAEARRNLEAISGGSKQEAPR